jgi:hypothetical protein
MTLLAAPPDRSRAARCRPCAERLRELVGLDDWGYPVLADC